MLYGTIVAQAQRIDVEGDRIVFRFGPVQTMLGDQVAQQKAWLEELASGAGGPPDLGGGRRRRRASPAPRRRVPAARPAAPAGPGARPEGGSHEGPGACSRCSTSFPAEVKDVTELK